MKKKLYVRHLMRIGLSVFIFALPHQKMFAYPKETKDNQFLFSIEDDDTPSLVAQTATPGAQQPAKISFPQAATSQTEENVLPGSNPTAIPVTIPAAPPLTPSTVSNGPNVIQNIELQDNNKQQEPVQEEEPESSEETQRTILINFNNVSMVEYIRFISRISNRNFIFDENDLQFNVTIVSEEPATIDNIMMALLQELRIHDLNLIEQGNNLIIHRNPKVNSISKIAPENATSEQISKLQADLITQVFRLNTISPLKAADIVRPLTSAGALVEVLEDSNNLIVTDISTNVVQIGKLLKSIDSPQSGLVVGQYVVKQGIPEGLINLTQQIMEPIALDQPLTMVSHVGSNSVFIVATPYLVDRTLSIMQYLDQTQGTTQILNLKGMNFSTQEQQGQWELDENGNWRYRTPNKDDIAPKGSWSLDSNGNWKFTPGEGGDENWIKDANGNWVRSPTGKGGPRSPDGQWIKDANGNWIFQLAPGKQIAPEKLTRKEQTAVNLPIGHIERTKFHIYRLHYRQAALIEQSLRKIGQSLKQTNTNADLVAAIDTIQSIEATNSLIFTGTASALDKLKELIEEVDRPLRQVFLELLILETSLTDSLNFGVNWGSRFGGGSSAGSQAFLSAGSPLVGGLDTTVAPSRPVATGLARNTGFNLGVLGQHLTRGGIHFNSIGALVTALHDDDRQNIVLNPKILTEDNSPAEIFVGINIPYPTQSIANDFGNIITQNFQYLDVGVRFKVTPLIGESDLITLDIEEEKTDVIPNPNPNLGQALNPNIITGPTTSKSKTTTRVHMPNGYFLILSGQIEDKIQYHRSQIPCLGGIPILGAAFSERRRTTEKRNLMLFIRPLIIDTYEDMHNITKHQQDIWKNKNCVKASWKYETQQALEFFNLRDELYPNYDVGSDCECE
ncbi:MAG TPA: secretin N-terminal domain-containing protein [Parachlamydiaceae bacterium]|nr:secretin N-terminal domain-containing protein [Parachlamydiaceae bacterium]